MMMLLVALVIIKVGCNAPFAFVGAFFVFCQSNPSSH